MIKEVNFIQVHFISAISYAAEQSRCHKAYSVPPACPPPVQKGECHANFIRKVGKELSVFGFRHEERNVLCAVLTDVF